MPTRTTILRWLVDKNLADFHGHYAHARNMQADTFVDEMKDIADDVSLDPNDRRVRIDTRKWVAMKILPKKYGDRVIAEHTGADGGPIKHLVEVATPRAAVEERLGGIRGRQITNPLPVIDIEPVG